MLMTARKMPNIRTQPVPDQEPGSSMRGRSRGIGFRFGTGGSWF
jgi:hypothetical protein